MYYILHKLAKKPYYGYEILREIDRRTQGAWKPSSGSLYPMFKKMLKRGLIVFEEVKEGERVRKLYKITQKGLMCVKRTKEIFLTTNQSWSVVKRLLIDMLDIEDIPKFVIDGSKRHFELIHEVLKRDELDKYTLEFILREYEINLEMEIHWIKEEIRKVRGESYGEGNRG